MVGMVNNVSHISIPLCNYLMTNHEVRCSYDIKTPTDGINGLLLLEELVDGDCRAIVHENEYDLYPKHNLYRTDGEERRNRIDMSKLYNEMEINDKIHMYLFPSSKAWKYVLTKKNDCEYEHNFYRSFVNDKKYSANTETNSIIQLKGLEHYVVQL